MRAIHPLLLGLLAILALPQAGADDVWASGRIAVGNPTTTFFYSTNVLQHELTRPLFPPTGTHVVDGIDSFFFDTPPAGWSIATRTHNGGEIGYALNVYFRDANYRYLPEQPCATGWPDETCVVPARAAHANVDAVVGRDLTVEILASPRSFGLSGP